MKERVLITGASGFVGYHLVGEAISQGYEVYAAVRKSSKIDHLKGLPLQYVYLDYSSVDHLQKDLESKDYHYIIHGAGVTKAKNQVVYNQINAEASKNLALACAKMQGSLKKFVLISSLAALGPSTDLDALLHDNSEPKPVTAYGKSKLLAEQHLLKIPNLPLVGFRPTAVYGPRERDLFILFKTINRGLDPYIGKFDQQLSFIYVKDMVKIVFKSLQVMLPKHFYNVSDGLVYDRYALADSAKKVLKKNAFRLHLPLWGINLLASFMDKLYERHKDTPVLNKEKVNELTAVNWGCDISSLEKDLDIKPHYDLEAGLAETIQWYQKNRWL